MGIGVILARGPAGARGLSGSTCMAAAVSGSDVGIGDAVVTGFSASAAAATSAATAGAGDRVGEGLAASASASTARSWPTTGRSLDGGDVRPRATTTARLMMINVISASVTNHAPVLPNLPVIDRPLSGGLEPTVAINRRE